MRPEKQRRPSAQTGNRPGYKLARSGGNPTSGLPMILELIWTESGSHPALARKPDLSSTAALNSPGMSIHEDSHEGTNCAKQIGYFVLANQMFPVTSPKLRMILSFATSISRGQVPRFIIDSRAEWKCMMLNGSSMGCFVSGSTCCAHRHR